MKTEDEILGDYKAEQAQFFGRKRKELAEIIHDVRDTAIHGESGQSLGFDLEEDDYLVADQILKLLGFM